MIIINAIGDNISVSCALGNLEYNTLYTKEKFDKLMELSDKSTKVTSKEELGELLTEVEALCKNDYKEKVEAFHPEIYVAPIGGKFYLKVGEKVSKVEIPEALVRRIEISMDKGVSVDPIIKFWKRALRNKKAGNREFMSRLARYIDLVYVDPRQVNIHMEAGLSEVQAEKLAETFEVKITNEGLLACYKTSNELMTKFEKDEDGNIVQVDRYKTAVKKFNADTGEIEEMSNEQDDAKGEDRVFYPYIMGQTGGDAFYCEGNNGYEKPGHFIKIGCTHRLPDWSFVNCDDNVGGVKGLHLGGLSYIAEWDGADIHTCFVDPMHIGAIPGYCGSEAIRVLQYFVYGSLMEIDHNIYHSSTYAAQTDGEWTAIVAEILEAHGELKLEAQEAIDEITNL